MSQRESYEAPEYWNLPQPGRRYRVIGAALFCLFSLIALSYVSSL